MVSAVRAFAASGLFPKAPKTGETDGAMDEKSGTRVGGELMTGVVLLEYSAATCSVSSTNSTTSANSTLQGRLWLGSGIHLCCVGKSWAGLPSFAPAEFWS